MSKTHPTKRRKTILIVIALLVAIPLVLVAYNYIDMRSNKPLGTGSDFLFIEQHIVRSPAVPTENFYYATDVPPEEFATKFEGWSTGSISGLNTTSTRTSLKITNRNQYALVNYCSREQCDRDPFRASDFKNKKYMLQILGTSMYYLNPSNIHWSMKKQIQEDIQRNYIR